MRAYQRIIVIGLIAIVSAVAGLAVGYFKGAEDWAGYTSLSEAASTVTQLKELREKRVAVAIRLLETELDSLVVRRAIYEQGFRPMKYLSSRAEDDRFIRSVAEYRRTYPSPSNDESVRLFTDELLKE